jgi:hypothetical protein
MRPSSFVRDRLLMCGFASKSVKPEAGHRRVSATQSKIYAPAANRVANVRNHHHPRGATRPHKFLDQLPDGNLQFSRYTKGKRAIESFAGRRAMTDHLRILGGVVASPLWHSCTSCRRRVVNHCRPRSWRTARGRSELTNIAGADYSHRRNCRLGSLGRRRELHDRHSCVRRTQLHG